MDVSSPSAAGGGEVEVVGTAAAGAEGKLAALVRLVSSVLEVSGSSSSVSHEPAACPTEEERVCIFGQWAGALQAAADALGAAGIAYLSLSGVGVGLAERLDALRRFGREGEPRVLLLCSEGFASGPNLQCARHVVLLHPFCPMASVSTTEDLARRSHAEAHAFDTQAIGRCARFPQEKQVRAYRLFVRGSVEEELLAAQGLRS